MKNSIIIGSVLAGVLLAGGDAVGCELWQIKTASVTMDTPSKRKCTTRRMERWREDAKEFFRDFSRESRAETGFGVYLSDGWCHDRKTIRMVIKTVRQSNERARKQPGYADKKTCESGSVGSVRLMVGIDGGKVVSAEVECSTLRIHQ